MPPKKKTNPEPANHRRVTVRDIAEEVGLHFTTVAEALRGSSRIKEATRLRVEEAARRLGYRPDPILSALSAYRSSNMRSSFQGVLVWINGFSEKDFFNQDHTFYGDCYQGALERAKMLGYKLEVFWIGEKRMSGKRASNILKARSILGIIVGPMPEMTTNIDIEWENFNSLRIGYSLSDSRITNVISDQFANTQWAFQRLMDDGFRRIGFACPRYLDNRVSNKFSGAFMSMVHRHFRKPPIPMFLDDKKEGDPEAFLAWYETYRPEVILAGGRSAYYRVLMEAGIKVPEAVQFVSLHSEYIQLPVAGISQNGKAVGTVAVDHLVGMIQRFKVGLESHPKTTMILGRWVEGESYQPELLKRAQQGP
ncbi:MAG: LacI family DNA-binding transcriptional regulator [Oceanipulchritudo sp.]